MEKKMLTVSSPPHIYGTDTTVRRMRHVIIALLPAAVASLYCYGLTSFYTIIIAVIAAMVGEFVFQKIAGKEVTINDGSAVITGILLAFNLPPDVPFWIPILGSLFAIIIVKQFFGGLGSNFMNPALAARAFLLVSYPVYMNNWTLPVDTTASATYLTVLKEDPYFVPQASDYMSLLFGKMGGCIGETSAVAVLIGGLYLIALKIINWRVPVFYIGSFAVFSFIFGRETFFSGNIIFEILSGGLMLGAFFMATDYATTPISPNGKIVMGIGCGLLTVLIRVYGGYPEGVSYAILIMNLFVPLIDKYIRPRVYGSIPKRRKLA